MTLPEGRCLMYRRSITHHLSDEPSYACSNLIMWHALNEIKLLLKVQNIHQTSCKVFCQFLLISLKAHWFYDRAQMDLTSAVVALFKTSKLTVNYWSSLSSCGINCCSPGMWGFGIKSIHNLCAERAYSFWLKNTILLPWRVHDFYTYSLHSHVAVSQHR